MCMLLSRISSLNELLLPFNFSTIILWFVATFNLRMCSQTLIVYVWVNYIHYIVVIHDDAFWCYITSLLKRNNMFSTFGRHIDTALSSTGKK